jgi:tryptophanyl-tRNA synthetase
MATGCLGMPVGHSTHWSVADGVCNLLLKADYSSDDEKFLFKHELKPDQTRKFARENAKDIIACGFDVERTFIFSNYAYMGGPFYENVSRVSRQISYNQAKATFGFNES